MRLNVKFLSVAAISPNANGVTRVPVNCWRLTVVTGVAEELKIDGVPVKQDATDNLLATTASTFTFTVGGVMANGQPVNLDQVLTFSSTRKPRAFLVLEYLEA